MSESEVREEPVEQSMKVVYLLVGTIVALFTLGYFVIDETQADTARETTQDQQLLALNKADTQNDKEHTSINDSIDELKTEVKESSAARKGEYREIMGAITDLKVAMAKKNGSTQ